MNGRRTLRWTFARPVAVAILAAAAAAVFVVACGGGGQGARQPTIPSQPTVAVGEGPDYVVQDVDPATLCFDVSALPEGLVLESELTLDNATSVERHTASLGGDPERVAELTRLYETWGRVTGAHRSFSPPSSTDQQFEFESVSCTVELYQDAKGATQAFADWGYQQRPLLGAPERGTFREVASPAVGAESRQYLTLHAVVWDSSVIFRTENVLLRVDVGARSGTVPEGLTESSPGEALTDYAASLAQALLERIERELARND